MIITAHGGANNTGRNSIKYLTEMEHYNIDAIEVDIWPFRGRLICNHNPPLTSKGKLSLQEVFAYVKRRNIMINCDVKTGGLVKGVVALAREMGIESLIYFTGSVKPYEIEHLGRAKCYVNRGFFRRYKLKDVAAIKSYLDSFENITGININYRYASESFLDNCLKNDLQVSLFTVDNLVELKRLLQREELANITTNKIAFVMEYLNQ